MKKKLVNVRLAEIDRIRERIDEVISNLKPTMVIPFESWLDAYYHLPPIRKCIIARQIEQELRAAWKSVKNFEFGGAIHHLRFACAKLRKLRQRIKKQTSKS